MKQGYRRNKVASNVIKLHQHKAMVRNRPRQHFLNNIGKYGITPIKECILEFTLVIYLGMLT